MYHDDASQLRARIDMLEDEVRQYALMHTRDYVPRGTTLDVSRLPRPLILFNLEWVTAQYIDLLVTDLHWADEEEADGTIAHLMIGGKVALPGRRRDTRGRLTLELTDYVAFSGRRLCDVLGLVEFMQPLLRLDAVVQPGPERDLTGLAEPIRTYRCGAAVQEITAVRRNRRFSRATQAGLEATVVPLYGGQRGQPARVSLADRRTFDRWTLEAIVDALGPVPAE